jgi:hypothetical protein
VDSRGGQSTTMMQFLGQMLKLPISAFVIGIEMIARVMREFQKTFDQSIDAVASGGAETLGKMSDGGSRSNDKEAVSACKVALAKDVNASACTNMEDDKMPDVDLSGDDLKLVRYKIVYTLRDKEAVLKIGDELVNYSTTAADFGGRKVTQYVTNLLASDPEKAAGLDSRYISSFVEVLQRFPKQEKEYDKMQVAELEKIRERLDKGITISKI